MVTQIKPPPMAEARSGGLTKLMPSPSCGDKNRKNECANIAVLIINNTRSVEIFLFWNQLTKMPRCIDVGNLRKGGGDIWGWGGKRDTRADKRAGRIQNNVPHMATRCADVTVEEAREQSGGKAFGETGGPRTRNAGLGRPAKPSIRPEVKMVRVWRFGKERTTDCVTVGGGGDLRSCAIDLDTLTHLG